jgi:signal recognition particle subunit SRP54
MIPGMSKLQLAGKIDQNDMENRLKRVEAIINAMTIKERANPKILNASRRRRIAAGTGVQVRDVNDVLTQFQQMQTLMSQMRKGKMPKGMPNIFG